MEKELDASNEKLQGNRGELNEEAEFDKSGCKDDIEKNEESVEELNTVEMEEEIVTDILEEKINSLEEELEKIEEEKNTIYKKAQRLKADFVNFRRRSAKEKMGIGIQAKIELICEILPVVDNFERALDVKTDDEEFKKGVEMIYKQLVNTLKQEGLTEISTIDEKFDHKYHEAVEQVKDSEKESGTIIEEIEKGYLFEDRVVRPAKVKVSE